ncbi:hypothetical protein [Nostoc sp. CHAB 5715]|nr:hypothetical protein [Nostoc sp. CHAB 5715]MCC5624616.1 hypothetical protein [Nostoc sp. CHAB 5715]
MVNLREFDGYKKVKSLLCMNLHNWMDLQNKSFTAAIATINGKSVKK